MTPSKAAVKRGNKFLAPGLALAFVLAGSAVAEPTDYVLTKCVFEAVGCHD